MAEDVTRVYRGAVKVDAERWYHSDARVMADSGYAPSAEEWSTALGQQVLTVRYVHDPDQGTAVLGALDAAERESRLAVMAPPVSSPLSAALAAPPTPAPQAAPKGTNPLTILGLIVAAGAIWYFVSGTRGGSNAATTPQPTERPAPAATAKPWTLDVSDAKYTTETVVGGSVFITVTISNTGKVANPAIEINFSELDKNADVRGCKPKCELDDLPGFGPSAVFPGLAAGATRDYEVEFIATKVGVVAWNVCVYDDRILDGESVYCGDGRTTIR
ncbi:MAG: hypothetical protein ABIZ57_03325 [Candidatus Limnocylindria bacterium]